MADLGPVAWPPAPIRTERLMLREPEARDRAAFIELLASPEVGTYLGGPRSRYELEREMPGAPERHPGVFIVDLDGAMIGQVILRRATGHGAGEAELGYLLLPEAMSAEPAIPPNRLTTHQCQGPRGSPSGRSGVLPAGGHQKSTSRPRSSGRRSPPGTGPPTPPASAAEVGRSLFRHITKQKA